MTGNDHTEMICIIDRSGSMEAIRNDAIGGFNAFLESQKKLPGKASVSLVLFDHEYEVPFQNVDLEFVKPLTEGNFVPRGTTALLDAIGRTLNQFGARIEKEGNSERPKKVIVCILTDGMENASKEFTRDKVKEMIEKRRKEDGWEFAFLAANQDAFAEAGAMGISRHMTANFNADKDGTQKAYAMMNQMTMEYRLKGKGKKKK